MCSPDFTRRQGYRANYRVCQSPQGRSPCCSGINMCQWPTAYRMYTDLARTHSKQVHWPRTVGNPRYLTLINTEQYVYPDGLRWNIGCRTLYMYYSSNLLMWISLIKIRTIYNYWNSLSRCSVCGRLASFIECAFFSKWLFFIIIATKTNVSGISECLRRY